ncbi:MAG: AsmA family protein, partial [Syntrophaceae bacterium]
MHTAMKKALLILGGIAGTLVLALVIFLLTFDADAYKPRLESAASQATGMNVRINGKMKLTLFPHAGFRLEEVLIKNQGADVLAVKRTEAAIRLLPLLKREVSIKHIRFIDPRVFITKDEKGRFNFATPRKKPAGKKFQARLGGAEEILINGGYLQYLDKKTGDKTEAGACDLTIHDISSDAGGLFRRLSFAGDFACKEFRKEALRISAIRGIMKVHEGILEANPITMKIFGGD